MSCLNAQWCHPYLGSNFDLCVSSSDPWLLGKNHKKPLKRAWNKEKHLYIDWLMHVCTFTYIIRIYLDNVIMCKCISSHKQSQSVLLIILKVWAAKKLKMSFPLRWRLQRWRCCASFLESERSHTKEHKSAALTYNHMGLLIDLTWTPDHYTWVWERQREMKVNRRTERWNVILITWETMRNMI